MIPITSYISTLHKLGWANVCYVFWYKFSLTTGIRERFFPTKEIQEGTFFRSLPDDQALSSEIPDEWERPLLEQANDIINGELTYFFHHTEEVGSPPNWFLNPFNGQEVTNPQKHWTELGDFDLQIGDIKVIWEPSRFYWLPTLARAYKVSGDTHYLDVINDWLQDWADKNPLNVGPNWKCGQETSIRLMHLLLTANILGQYENPPEVLQNLVWLHLQRIEANIHYAIAQDNNHGTSEASALYVGSSWLAYTGFESPKLDEFSQKGKRLLEDRIQKLIKKDGTFSQYSVNYHRMVLDTMSWVLWNEQAMDWNDRLSSEANSSIKKALQWLETLLDESGDAPNFGPNDGSMICRLDSNDYRDFRPSCRLLNALLGRSLSEDQKMLDETLFWLGITPDYQRQEEQSHSTELSHFPESGLIRINGQRSWMLFHYPQFEFRPSHCDLLHVDLWKDGKNILRDSGSYSYNTDRNAKQDASYFKSVKSHNTASFDGKEAMPKISRFLYAGWPQAENVKADTADRCCQASYRYRNQVNHKREVQHVEKDTWLVTDWFDGSYDSVTLRWRLIPGNWNLQRDILTVESDYAKIIIKTDSSCRLMMGEGYESRYYMQIQKLPVLVIRGDTHVRKIQSYIQLK